MTLLSPVPEEVQRLLVTLREAATMTALSERTLWGRCRIGELRSVRIGTRLRISVDELRDWIARQSASQS